MRGAQRPSVTMAARITCLLLMLPAIASDEADRWLKAVAPMPPALAADVLIRVAVAPDRLRDIDRVRLLAKAFNLAGEAHELFGKVNRLPHTGENRARYVALSTRIGVDRLALQSRVVRAVLAIDRSAARALFARVEMPALPPASCSDVLVPDVTEYFNAARLILAETPWSERSALLERIIERVESPLQLAPAAHLLAESDLSGADWKRLVVGFADRMRGMGGGDPAFRHSVVNQRLAVAVEGLARKCAADPELAGTLVFAFREFLLAHLNGPGCHESFLPEGRREIRQAAVDPFNAQLRLPGQFTRDGLPPLEFDEIWPSGADNGRPDVAGFWQDSEAESLWMKSFRPGKEGGGSPAEPALELSDLAGQVSAWQRPEGMTAEDFFHQKLLLYGRVARALPSGPERQRAVATTVALLAGSPMQGRAPAEWLWHIAALLGVDALREDVLEAMSAASDPALQVYAELERRFPRSMFLSGAH